MVMSPELRVLIVGLFMCLFIAGWVGHLFLYRLVLVVVSATMLALAYTAGGMEAVLSIALLLGLALPLLFYLVAGFIRRQVWAHVRREYPGESEDPPGVALSVTGAFQYLWNLR